MTEDFDQDHPSKPRPRRGRFTGIRPKLIALCLSTGAALVAGEITVRCLFQEELDTETLRQENRTLSIGNLIEPAADPEQLYVLKRGLLEEWLNVLVATSDVARVRISTLYPPPIAPSIRIAVIGDSSPFGYRVFYEASYPASLRVALEREFGVPIEVRNYSVPGYNSVQERAMLEEALGEWDPDLLILHYDHNDPDPQSHAPPGYIPPEYGDNFLGSKLVKFAMRRMRTRKNQRSNIFVSDDGTVEKLHGSLRSGGPRYDAHLEELRRMGRLLESRGIPSVAVIFEHGMGRSSVPSKDPHFTSLHPPLVAVLREAGFLVLDLYPDYQKVMHERDWKHLRALWVSQKDSHPNAFGHAFIAEHLRRFILETAPLKEALASAAKRSTPGRIDENRLEAARLFQQGLVLIDLKRMAEAHAELAKAIALVPDDAALRVTFAQTLIAQNQLREAAAELEKAVEIKADISSAHILLSRLYAYEKRYREAMDHHDTARETARLPLYKTSTSEGLADIFSEHASATEKADSALADALRSQAVLLYRLAGREDKAAALMKGFDRFQPRPAFAD